MAAWWLTIGTLIANKLAWRYFSNAMYPMPAALMQWLGLAAALVAVVMMSISGDSNVVPICFGIGSLRPLLLAPYFTWVAWYGGSPLSAAHRARRDRLRAPYSAPPPSKAASYAPLVSQGESSSTRRSDCHYAQTAAVAPSRSSTHVVL